MIIWIESLILGVVQGLTEFLPVSSDGHLLVAESLMAFWSGIPHSGKQNLLFDVILHLGTTIAIVVYYRAELGLGVRGLCGWGPVPPEYERERLVRLGWLVFLALLPLVPMALKFKKLIESTFEGVRPAAYGFMATAGVLLLTVWLNRRQGTKGLAEMSWLDALLIGVAQTLAPLPGVSRSGLTIAAGLALGLSRSWAVGFSLLLAVPTIAGAIVFEVKDMTADDFHSDRLAAILTATVVSGIVGYLAIAWLVKVVGSGRLWYFSVYLFVMAVVLLWLAPYLERPDDERRAGASAGVAAIRLD